MLRKLDHLQAERDRLEKQWSQKQSWLEGVLLEQVFYRDVNNLDRISSSQEVHHRSSALQRTLQPLLIVSEQLSNLHRSSCRRALWETGLMRWRHISNATMPLRSCLTRRMTRFVFYLCSLVHGSRTLAFIPKCQLTGRVCGILFMLSHLKGQKRLL